MKCVVLAAGYATRLYPLTENFPKPLLPVGGKPILNWLLDDIDILPEIDGHVIISNHKFISHFTKWKEEQNLKNPITILDDGSLDNDHRLGAVRDIQFAIETLKLEDDLLVIAGDNVLDFSLAGFVAYMREKGKSCVMCHEENNIQKQQKTAIIARTLNGLITSYEEKPEQPKGNLAVPPFYCYRNEDAKRITEALEDGCGVDAPGSFAAWLSRHTEEYAWIMPGKRYDIGDRKSYDEVCERFSLS